jgi:sorbitol-specific phosphotransferase system component IIA
MKFILCAAAIVAALGPASAHSWVEQLQVIDSATGKYTGDYGYTRGYISRTDIPGDHMSYLLPALSTTRTRIDNTDLLCKPSERTSGAYTNPEYPRLQATPGSFVAMKYLENGHVTLPLNQKGKDAAGGTVFVYGTTKPSDTEKIVDVLQWNTQGNGGDRRGTQLAAQSFDDGRCHQINPGTISIQRQQTFPDRVAGQPTSNVEQWCENDVHIPASYKPGDVLTVYWVWQWPTEPNADSVYPFGKDEYYTSCAEIDIVASVAGDGKPIHTLVQQDPQAMAVSGFMSRTALTASPLYTLAGGASLSVGVVAAAASSVVIPIPPVVISIPSVVIPTASPVVSATSAIVSTTSVAVSTASVAIPTSSVVVAYTSSSTMNNNYCKPSTTSPLTTQTNLPTDIPTITLPSQQNSPPFTNPSSSSAPSNMPNPNTPFQSADNSNADTTDYITVTEFDYVTMTAAPDKQHEPTPAVVETDTTTTWVTSYVTAAPSTVTVAAVATGATPDGAGNAGLIGRHFVRRSMFATSHKGKR